MDALAQQHKTGEYRKGENHRLAKLDEDKVRAIRAEWKQYDRKTLDGRPTRRGALAELGRKYGAMRECARLVISRKTWKHVE